MAWPLTKHISLIYLIAFIENSSCLQNGFTNQLDNILGPSQTNGITIQKSLNQIQKCPIHSENGRQPQHMGSLPIDVQQKILQKAALQQQLQAGNLQGANLQQGLNLQQQFNLQQPGPIQQLNLNPPASIQQLNLQSSSNLQPQANLQEMNLQHLANLQQQQFQQANLQQLNLQQAANLQQHNLPPTLASLQLGNHQIADVSSISQAPLVNAPLVGSNQILQQVIDPGIVLPPSPSLGYSNNFQPNVDSLSITYPQNSQATFNNIPSPVIDLSQAVNSAISPPLQISNVANLNNQQPVFSLTSFTPLQNQQSLNIHDQNQIPNLPNQVTIVKTVQPQATANPTQTVSEINQNELSLLSSLISETPSNQFSNGNPLLASLSKQGTKSSNYKSLLPLIFDLLKERKSGGCGCHNCGCMNNNKQEPQIFSGYANQNNHRHREEGAQNKDGFEDFPDDVRPTVSQNTGGCDKNTQIDVDSDEYASDAEYFDNYDDED